MSSTENTPSDVAEATPEKLNLEVNIESRGACERHITVTVPREEIDRYFDKAFGDLMGQAQVPGFRQGRAPRKLVESRFRKDVAEQVRGSLLMDSLAQVTEDHELAAISEPDLDVEDVVIPDDGPLIFEFNLEVRPDFDLPQWKGLQIERPTRDFTDADIDRQLEQHLARFGRLVPHEGAAEDGDYIVAKLRFEHDGQEISSSDEETIRIRKTLSFQDGRIDDFDKLMVGVKAGESRTAKTTLSEDAPNTELAGKTVDAKFEILEVKKQELPELTPSFLEQLGDFESEAELRDAVKESLERRLRYEQEQRAREQVLGALTVSADWELPPDLLRRQSERELQRRVLELRRNGFSDGEIRANENELRQNSRQSTARALKEHFILERIAEDQQIEAEPHDYDSEIMLIAAQSGESPRRVRAQLEKGNLMDTLRNQIIERKVIDVVLKEAKFKDVPFEPSESSVEAVSTAAGGAGAEASEAADEE